MNSGFVGCCIESGSVALNQGLRDLDEAYPNYNSLLDGMASFLQKIAFSK
ncbi:MAG: hypothetical protein Ct9H300mP4_14710 [Gammaproteobacteria bacterium]|nr:MAG: hypothetical protein Ct9H300mP4_14710 [Gammaproteobacteria bacterium]